MTKKNKNKQITQAEIDQIISALDKNMPDALRFAYASRNFKVFIHCISKIPEKDPFTKTNISFTTKAEYTGDHRLIIGQIIAKDIMELLDRSAYSNINTYSFAILLLNDNVLEYAKSVAVG